MAVSGLYDSGLEAFGKKLIDLTTDDIRAILIDTANYTPDLANHSSLTDVPVAARVAEHALANKTMVKGVFGADATTFPAVTGASAEAVLIYQYNGTDATSRLIAYTDSATSGLPVTPNGGDITVNWPTTGAKIFKL